MPVTKPFFISGSTRDQQWSEILVKQGAPSVDKRFYAQWNRQQQLARFYTLLGGMRDERAVAAMTNSQILAEIYEEIGGTVTKRIFEHWSLDQQLYGIYSTLGGVTPKLLYENGWTRDQQLAGIWEELPFSLVPPFDPNSIGGLILWINSENVVLDGVSVEQFVDLSSSAASVPQTDISNPTRFLNQLNGFPAVRFENFSKFVVTPALADSDVTIFFVGAAESTTCNVYAPFIVSSGYRMCVKTTFPEWGTYLGGPDLDSQTILSEGVYHVLEMTAGTVAGTTLTTDGILEATSAFDSVGSGSTEIGNEGAMDRHLNDTDFVEMLVWDHILTSGELDSVRNWLLAKYNLP